MNKDVIPVSVTLGKDLAIVVIEPAVDSILVKNSIFDL